jgi:hypothetical protein
MVVIKAVGGAFGFVLMSSAAIVAGVGLWISLRHSHKQRRHRVLITVLSLLAVIVGNAWFVWVFVFFPHQPTYNYEAYEEVCRIGIRVPMLSAAVGFLGTGVGRVFAVVGSFVLLLLWITIGARPF